MRFVSLLLFSSFPLSFSNHLLHLLLYGISPLQSEMKITPFKLEKWFEKYEYGADIMLAESGIRSLKADRFDLDPGDVGYVIPTNGDPDLRHYVAERYGRTEDEVLFTCGTQEANFLVFTALLSEHDHAVTVTPTYQALHSIPDALSEVTRVWLEPPTWELDVDEVAKAMRENTQLIILNNPNNPTGKYHPQEKVEQLYELAEEHDAYFLCDEVYRLLAEHPLDPVASMGNHGISTTSLTKAYGLAGTRFGWIAGSEEVIEKAWRWKDYTTISSSIFGQHIAKQALMEREEEILKENRKLARENREIVQHFLEAHQLEWHYPVGVNGFITVPEQFESSKKFCRRLVEEQGVVLAPGSVFGFDQYFRLGFGLPTSTLKEGLARLETLLHGENG